MHLMDLSRFDFIFHLLYRSGVGALVYWRVWVCVHAQVHVGVAGAWPLSAGAERW